MSMRRLLPFFLMSVLLVPAVALADTITMDFSSGPLSAWLGRTLGFARQALLLMLFLGLAAEAFGKPPGQGDFAGVVRRFFLVAFLLLPLGATGVTPYSRIMGEVMETFQGVAKSWGTKDAWARMSDATGAFWAAKAKWNLSEVKSSNGVLDLINSVAGLEVDGVGGALLTAALSLILALAQASLTVLNASASVLTGVLFILGPLPIVASIPAGVGGFGRWMRVFVSVLTWPVISAILVDLVTSFVLKTLKPNTSYETAYQSLAIAGLMMFISFAVPVLASALTGASMGAVGAGWSALAHWGGFAMSMASRGAGAVTPRDVLGGASAGAGGARGSILPSAGIGDGLGSALPVGGLGGGGSPAPAWARAPLARAVPGVAAVSPSADAALGGDARQGLMGPPGIPEAPTERPVHADWAKGGISPAQGAPGAFQPPRPFNQPPPAPVEMRGPALDAVGLQRMRFGDAEGLLGASPGNAPPAVAPAMPKGSNYPTAPMPKVSEQAFANWRRAHPGANHSSPEARQQLFDEEQRLAGGGSPVAAPAGGAARVAPSREGPTAPLPWVSDEAFANWRRAHPGANHASPEARQQLLDAERALASAPTPRVPLEAHFVRILRKPAL